MQDDLVRPWSLDRPLHQEGNVRTSLRLDRTSLGSILPAPHRNRRDVLRAGVICVILIGAGGVLWAFGRTILAPVQIASVPPAMAVTTMLPLQETVTRQTELTGQFSAVNQVTLLAQVSGYLTEIHFQDGQLVDKGDLLFVIDPRPYEIQLQRAVSQYQTAEAALALATQQVGRTAQLNHQQFASDELLDQRTESQRAAAASVQTAEAAIRAAQLNLEFTRISAPFRGRMSMRRVSIGSLISGGSNATGSTALTSIVSVDPIHLDFDMSEADYAAYQRSIAHQPVGIKTTVQISLDGETPWSRTGTLDFIDNQLDRSSGTMHARATLRNPDLAIAPGQFARVRLPVSPAQPELLVPDTALASDQSTKMVMVAQADGTAAPKQVTIGALTESGMRVVTSGLLPTDRVIIDNLVMLRPGLRVTATLAPPPISPQQ
jgi:multidrug efflux system membrane fusion protein